MTLRVDPEKNEIHALKEMTEWRGKRVLEIGCGDERLTRRLANLGAQLEAVDPDKRLIALARKQFPERYADRVKFKVGTAENLKSPPRTFDIVVFAWSL